MRKLLLFPFALAPAVVLAQGAQPGDLRIDARDIRSCNRAGCVSPAMNSAAGFTASRSTPDRARDHISIRDFLPTPACDGVMDDSPTVYAAMRAMAGTGRSVAVPGDCRLNIGPAARLYGNRITLDGTGLVGEGGRDSASASGVYGTRGGTLLLTDTGGPAFIAKRNWQLKRLIFYWPGMTEAAAVANGGMPITLPALLTGPSGAGLGTSEVTSGTFVDNDVLNAWDVLDFSADAAGGLQIHGNRAFFEDAFLKLSKMPLESYIYSNDFTPNAFQSAPGMLGVYTTNNLVNWAAAHAADVMAVGNGTAVTGSINTVDGLSFFGNTTYGLGYGFLAAGGTFNILHAVDNAFDGVPHIAAATTGGLFTGNSAITGVTGYSYTFGRPTLSAAITAPILMSADSAPKGELALRNFDVTTSTGGIVDWESGLGVLDLLDVHVDHANSGGSTSPISPVTMNSPGGRLRVITSRMDNAGTAPGPCINVPQPLQFMQIVGNALTSCSAALSIGGEFTTPNLIAANHSYGTTGPTAYVGAMAYSMSDLANVWDKPGPNWEPGQRGFDGAYQLDFQGNPVLSLTPQGNATVPGRFLGATPFTLTRALPAAVQTFTGAKTQALFAKTVTDTTRQFANSTFTAPEAGNYDVFASIDSDGTGMGSGDVWTISVDQAGSIANSSNEDHAVTPGQIGSLDVHEVVQLATGDTVKISVTRNAGTGTLKTIADASRSRFVVHEIQ